MPQTPAPGLRVITNPNRPFSSDLTKSRARLTLRQGGLDLTQAGMDEAAHASASGADGLRLAFETVESALRAENWFLKKVRAELEKTAPLSEFPTVTGTNGHDYLFHFTQFLFFLNALDCTDADQISNFIEAHNQKIEGEISSPDFHRSVNEFKKAIIRPERKAKILDTVRLFRRPVFAIYDFGHLLIGEMSPKTTEKLIEDLRYGKILERRTDERMSADQKRILIASTGFLEDTYRTSLLMQRRMMARGMSEEEYRRATADI